MKKKLSIILPVYNTAEYLTECLESVIKQTYNNIEIICMDDGSTDNSRIICEKYAKSDNRIRVFHQENKGKSAACNKALEYVTGDYISIIDSDDYLDAKMYDALINNMEVDKDIDIAICGYFKKENNEILAVENSNKVPEYPLLMKDFFVYIYERDKYRNVASYFWNRVFKKDILKREGNMLFDEDLNVGEDVLASAESYLRAKKVIYMETPYYYYRQNPKSLSHTNTARIKNIGSCKAYNKVIELFEQEKIDFHIINLLKRFFVYHAGLYLEILLDNPCIENGNKHIEYLIFYIKEYLGIYIELNKEQPERIVWIKSLVEQKQFII